MAETRWQVVSAEHLLDRAQSSVVELVWPALARWSTPEQTQVNQEQLRDLAAAFNRVQRAAQLLELADWLSKHPGALDEPEPLPLGLAGITEASRDVAALVIPTTDTDEPVLATKGVLRVAARVSGEPVDKRNRLTDGRLAVARLIGYGPTSRQAHLALIEVATSICRPVDPTCDVCPLSSVCHASRADEIVAARLF